MSGNLTRILVGVIIALILLGVMVTYQVRFTESAVVETFGRLAGPVGPGLHMRWPWPVQRVTTYDMRKQQFESVYEQMNTADRKNITVAVFAYWKVDDAMKFRRNVGRDLARGRRLLEEAIRNQTNSVVAKYDMDAFASEKPGAVKLEDMEEMILAGAKDLAANEYGIELLRVGLMRTMLPEDVSVTVLDNMRSERMEKAQKARSEGDAEAEAIKAQAQSTADQVIAFAQLRAEEIRARGRAEAAKYYKDFQADEGFAMFLARLKYLSKALPDSLFLLTGGPGEYEDASHGWFGTDPTAADVKAEPAK